MKLKKITAFPFVMLKFVEKKIYSVFRKDTFNGIYTNFSSFKALEYKLALLYTLYHRCFTIFSDFAKFHFEVQTLQKNILQKNADSVKFVDKCILKFLDNIYGERPYFTTVSKLEV